MGFLEWATSPWGQRVPIHIAWFLIWVAAIAGLLFLMVHATYVRYFAKHKEFAGGISPLLAARIPERVPRHSLTARLFHWIMAAAMFTLLFTAFLPRVGVQFDWVTYHWIAGSDPHCLDHLSRHPCFLLYGFLVHLARQHRSARRARRRIRRFLGKPAPAAGPIRQVSAGEQAVPRRHHRWRACPRSSPACS